MRRYSLQCAYGCFPLPEPHQKCAQAHCNAKRVWLSTQRPLKHALRVCDRARTLEQRGRAQAIASTLPRSRRIGWISASLEYSRRPTMLASSRQLGSHRLGNRGIESEFGCGFVECRLVVRLDRKHHRPRDIPRVGRFDGGRAPFARPLVNRARCTRITALAGEPRSLEQTFLAYEPRNLGVHRSILACVRFEDERRSSF